MKKALLIVAGLGLLLLHCESDEKRVKQRYSELLQQWETRETPDSLPIARVPSLNFNLRGPSYIILHHTALFQCEEALNHLVNPASRVSAHYLICKDGSIYQLIDDHARAWHAGESRWGTLTDMNSVSLGIELDNAGFEPFPEAQIKRLISLLHFLQERYRIPPANILGHGEIAPGRKEDPHCLFPWQTLADSGIVLMPNNDYSESFTDHFDPIAALSFIGYDTRFSVAAIEAFRRRYIGCKADTGALTIEEISVLHNVYMKHLSSKNR